jgi:hypothetical protein
MTQQQLFEALEASDVTLDGAIRAYQSYLAAEKLPQLSADELLAESILTNDQRHTVRQFLRWYENAVGE